MKTNMALSEPYVGLYEGGASDLVPPHLLLPPFLYTLAYQVHLHPHRRRRLSFQRTGFHFLVESRRFRGQDEESALPHLPQFLHPKSEREAVKFMVLKIDKKHYRSSTQIAPIQCKFGSLLKIARISFGRSKVFLPVQRWHQKGAPKELFRDAWGRRLWIWSLEGFHSLPSKWMKIWRKKIRKIDVTGSLLVTF